MERMLAWKTRRAKESARGAGWLHEDRPVARPDWDKVEQHSLPGLAVYLVPDRAVSSTPEGSPGSGKETTQLFRDDGRVTGLDGSSTASSQLRFDFDRDPRDPNQQSLIEDPASAVELT